MKNNRKKEAIKKTDVLSINTMSDFNARKDIDIDIRLQILEMAVVWIEYTNHGIISCLLYKSLN